MSDGSDVGIPPFVWYTRRQHHSSLECTKLEQFTLEKMSTWYSLVLSLIISSVHALHVVVFGTHRPVGRTFAACATQRGWNVTRVVPGVDIRSVLEGPIDLLAVDGTCVTPVGVDLLRRRHGERVCVAHSRDDARFAIRNLEEGEMTF